MKCISYLSTVPKTKLAEAKLKEMGETDVLTHKDIASGRHFWEITTTTEEKKDAQ